MMLIDNQEHTYIDKKMLKGMHTYLWFDNINII